MYEYLKNTAFLKELDALIVKDIYVKITALDWDENPIQEIQSRVLDNSSVRFDGTSSVRRTCSVQMLAETDKNNLDNLLGLTGFNETDLEELLAMNKKVKVELGYKNYLTDYVNKYGDIIWFPLGIYVISSPTLSHTTSGVNINLELRDKMSLLNGDCGGTIPASVTLSDIEDYDEDGESVISHPTIFQIIQELVHHYGGIPISQIYINDLDLMTKSTQKYIGTADFYKVEYIDEDGKSICKIFTDETSADNFIKTSGYSCEKIICKEEQDVGYIYTDFTYPGELVANPGQTVVDMLDTIKNTLGNYEYFFDIEGNFVFQEKKNYLNTSYSTTELLKNKNDNNYQVDFSSGKSVYSFEDTPFAISYGNTPNTTNVKNDYIIWGVRKSSASEESWPIRYHLAIDKKPQIGNTYECAIIETSTDIYSPIALTPVDKLPTTGKVGVYYKNTEDGKTYKWGKIDDTAEYDELNTELSTLETLKEKLESQLESTEDDIEECSTFLSEKETLEKELNTMKDTISSLKTNKTVIIVSESDSTRTASSKEQEALQDALDELEEEYEKNLKTYTKNSSSYTESTLSSSTESKTAIETQLTSVEQQISDKEQEIVKCKKNLYKYIQIDTYKIKTVDWREELYMQGATAAINGIYGNEYYVELKNEWPKLVDYNPENLTKNEDGTYSLTYSDESGYFKPIVITSPTSVDYFLDFIDSDSSINKYNVSAIGKRSKIVGDSDSKTNCIFSPEIEDLVFLNEDDDDYEEKKSLCDLKGQKYAIVNSQFASKLATGGTYYSCYSYSRDLLYQYTCMNEVVSLTSIPIYYLEPNTRITIKDEVSNIGGDYMIQSISLPLGANGSMTISASKALERI